MKKLLLVVVALALVFAVSVPSQAQEKMSLSVGADLLLPMGTFGDAVSMGFGGSVRGQYNITPMFSAGVETGYFTWSAKSGDVGYSFHGIPFRVFGKYFFMPEGKLRVYGMFELGFFFGSTGDITITTPGITIPGLGTIGGGTQTVAGGSSTDFNYVPVVGVEFPVGSGKTKLDASLRYDGIATTGGSSGNLGVRVGVNFPIGG